MQAGARTPEELDSLFEDAFVTRDAGALPLVFADGAVVAGDGAPEARGANEIGRLVATLWMSGRTYVAEPRRVVQARDTALVIGERGINVARRDAGGRWRYAIAFLSLETSERRR